jgi:hypothetical protein
LERGPSFIATVISQPAVGSSVKGSGGLEQFRRFAVESSHTFGQRHNPGLRTPNRSALLAPLVETAANVLRVEAEDFADVLVGERPFTLAGIDPFLGVLEEEAAPGVPGQGILLVALDGVLQNGQHEAALADQTALTGEGCEVLCRQQSVRLKKIYETISHRVLLSEWTA